jgi:DNA-binding SARP family transcriptional activator
VAIVSRMLGSPLDRAAVDPLIFGRDDELAALLGRYESAELQPGPVVRVVGEAGVGKTALLELLDNHVHRRGGEVRWVCVPRDDDHHSLWSPLMAALRHGVDGDTLRAVLGADLGDRAEPADPRRRSELLGRLLEWSAHRRPHLVVIDDADRADAASLLQVLEVAAALRPLPLLIVLAYRGDEIDQDAANVLDTPAAGPIVRVEGLAGDDLHALVASELGIEPSAALLAAVTRLTGGTPGFVRETVARLGPAGAAEPFGGLVVPEGLRELLERRMARLAAGDAEVVRVAAVLGEPVDEAVVAAATGLSRTEVSASLAAAAHLRILRRGDDGRWQFTSSISARVLATDVPERHRERHHRRAADHLESLAGLPDAPPADALAEHLLAGRDGNATRVVRWVTQAAAEAELRGDVDRAVGLCQRALDLVGADPSARGRLLLRVASARRLRGGDAESSGAFLAAVNAARAANDVELFARAVVGHARARREFWTADDTLVPLLEEALERLPDHDSPARVHVEARLSEVGTAGSAVAGRDRVVDLSTEASDRAYRLGDAGSVASALAAWYWTLTGMEDASARLDVAAELARHAAETADWELVLDARRFRHHDLLGLGDIARADIELAAFARLVAEHPLAGSPWRLGVARAGRALLDGRFDDAETLSAEAAAAAGPVTASGLPAELRVAQRLLLAREVGELPAMTSVIREIVETRPERPFWRAAHAWLQAETGHLAGARAELSRLVVDELAAIEPGPHWLSGVWLLGETAVKVGRRDDAERVYRALLPWSDAVVVVPMSTAVLGSVAKVLGQLAAALGDFDDAVAHFEAAIDHEIRLGAGPLLAWTRLAYARTLLLAGAQPTRGEAQLADAVETGRGYGMHGMLAAAGELAQRVAASPAAPAPGAGAPSVSGPAATVGASVAASPSAAPAATQAVVRRPRPTSRLRCLGGFELELRGRTIDVRALKPRVQAVLWVLAAQAGRPVHSEQLIDALWPGVPSTAGRRNLQVAISSLRQSLEPGVKRGPWHTVAREGDTYRLVLGDDVDADIRTFELAVAAAGTLRRGGRHTDAADRYEHALRVYGGDLIPEAGPADWIIGRRDGLRLAAADAAQSAAELRLDAGDVGSAVTICERGLQIDRYRDGLWRLLIRCCEVDGNPAAAARAQREYEAVLAELGLSPP